MKVLSISGHIKSINIKVQGVPQSQVSSTPCHHVKENWTTIHVCKTNKQRHEKHIETHRAALSSPREIITMLKELNKRDQGARQDNT